MPMTVRVLAGIAAVICASMSLPASAAQPDSTELDRRVEKFLESREGTWKDLNVPEVDGRTLRDLIVKRGFKNALEIGTSTGHSAIWIAWGLSKTGGKLTTIEIDPRRHKIALENFEEAGLSDYIDAQLADAHELVPKLSSSYDFVFSDADKEWYTKYFQAVWPRMPVGGCFTAHNVTMNATGIQEFLEHLKTVKNGETTIDEKSRAGLSITCKTSQ
jgi:caffeoyl-CoA O-methyltransferase